MNEDDEIRIALRESVRLQSHYAKLLNAYDGGKRLSFDSPGDWMLRLKECRVTDERIEQAEAMAEEIRRMSEAKP